MTRLGVIVDQLPATRLRRRLEKGLPENVYSMARQSNASVIRRHNNFDDNTAHGNLASWSSQTSWTAG